MNTTRPQMILIAVLVCMFAVGMAGFLNFFKYRSNAERLIKERLVVTGTAIENSIRSSLSLGLQFADLGTLPNMLERERATDDLILSIEVFDTEGKPLYSTDRLRATRDVPIAWLAAAQQAKGADWFVKSGTESAAGIAIENSFGLIVGYLALRYSEAQVSVSTMALARELAVNALMIFVVAAAFASLALSWVMNRMARDFEAVEATLRSPNPLRPNDAARKGPFGESLKKFFESVRSAEAEIIMVRGGLERGAER